MRTRMLLAVMTLFVCSSLLIAHDLFIKLDSYFVSPNSEVRIPILNGVFNLSENAITPDRVPDVSVVNASGREHLGTTAWDADGDTTFLTLQTGEAGTYVVGASTRSRDLGMSGEDFNTYLEHDGIPDVLEQRRQNNELDKDAWERYSKHVKAVFQVGDKRDRPASWWQFWKKDEPAYVTVFGYPAEIVPLVNPYLLEIGDEITVRCLVDGEPVANQLVIAGGENQSGAMEERSSRTDADGAVTFTVDAPGKWYLKFINMVPVAGQSIAATSSNEGTVDEELDYMSKWATLTFAIDQR